MENNTAHGIPASARYSPVGTRLAARRTAIAGLAAFIALGSAACTPAEQAKVGASQPSSAAEAPTVETPQPSASPAPTAPTAQPSAPAPAASPNVQPAAHRDITIAGHGTSRLRFGPWTSKPARSLPGALYLRGWKDESRATFAILVNGQLRSTTLLGPKIKWDCSMESAEISPDGKLAMWVEGDPLGNHGGNLIVAPFAMSGVTHGKIVATGVRCSGGAGPQWMADSRRLLIDKADEPNGILDVRSGAFVATPTWHDYMAFSPGNGAFVARSVDGAIVVQTAGGKVLRRMPFDLGQERSYGGFAVQSISPDGRYVAVGAHNTDPQTFWNAPYLVDTVARKELEAPVKVPAGGKNFDLHFLANGGMLQTTSTGKGVTTLYLVDAARTVVASIPLDDHLRVNAYWGR